MLLLLINPPRRNLPEKLISRTFWHSHSVFDARLCVRRPVLLWIVLWIHVCAVTLNKTGEQEFGDISGKLISPSATAASWRRGKRISHTKALARFCPLATFKFWTDNYLQPLTDSSWHTNTTHTHTHELHHTVFIVRHSGCNYFPALLLTSIITCLIHSAGSLWAMMLLAVHQGNLHLPAENGNNHKCYPKVWMDFIAQTMHCY